MAQKEYSLANQPGQYVESMVMLGLDVSGSPQAANLLTNIDTSALITAAGTTTTQNSSDQTNINGRGVKVVLDMTVVGTGSVTLSIQGKDAASGAYYTILTGAAITTNSVNVYEVYPGITATANVSASATLPRTWRVLVTANNANPVTYIVGASVIL